MYEDILGLGRRWLVTSAVVGFVAVPRLRSNPQPAYRALRLLDPAHESPIGIWVLSRHREVNAALRNSQLGSDETKADLAAIRLGPLRRLLGSTLRKADGARVADRGRPAAGASGRSFRELMLFRDPPDHARLRSLVSKAFTPRAVDALEERITELTHRQLDRVERRGEMEFLADFAYPVPAMAICELMGAPSRDHELIMRNAPALATRLDPSPMRSPAVMAAADRAAAELSRYLDGLIAQRRRDPGDDILSALIAAEDDGDRLSHDELVATAMLLLIAGHETTANLLGNGLLALLRHPEEWQRLRNDPDLDRSAVEELMRFDGPIQMTERVALDDVQVGDAAIPKGRVAILCLAAANWDPDVFDHPNVLDIERDPNPHLGFGGGAHFCIGAALARMEARIALRAIAQRLPNLSVAVSRPRWRPSFTIRGLRELPLSWQAPL
jgi:pimeloyl-[acyl-carrier protein] synthase